MTTDSESVLVALGRSHYVAETYLVSKNAFKAYPGGFLFSNGQLDQLIFLRYGERIAEEPHLECAAHPTAVPHTISANEKERMWRRR